MGRDKPAALALFSYSGISEILNACLFFMRSYASIYICTRTFIQPSIHPSTQVYDYQKITLNDFTHPISIHI